MSELKNSRRNCMRKICDNVLNTNIFYELERLVDLYFDESLSKDLITDYVTFFDSEELKDLSSEKDLLKVELIKFMYELCKDIVAEIDNYKEKSYIDIFRLYKAYKILMHNANLKIEFNGWRANKKLRFAMEAELFINTSPLKNEPKMWLEWFSLIE